MVKKGKVPTFQGFRSESGVDIGAWDRIDRVKREAPESTDPFTQSGAFAPKQLPMEDLGCANQILAPR